MFVYVGAFGVKIFNFHCKCVFVFRNSPFIITTIILFTV